MSLLPALALALAVLAPTGRTLVVGPAGDFADLAAALAASRAGDTVLVRGGVHPGPVVVDEAVALVGEGRPVIDGGGQGTVVTFNAPGGALRGFVIRNSGTRNDKEDSGVIAHGQVELSDNVIEDVQFGVDVKQGPRSVLRGNRITGRDLDIARKGDGIRLWESHDSVVEDNVVVRARDVVMWYSNGVRVRRNRVSASRYGLHFMYASGSEVSDNVFDGNAVGSYAMYSQDLTYTRNQYLHNHGPSGYGVALKDSDSVVLDGNVFVSNRTGLYFDNSPMKRTTPNLILNNTFAFNDIGLAFMPSVKGNVFADNNFVENWQQVAVLSSGTFQGNEWTPGGRGNYWSGYAGYDADRDGLGDVPYQEVSLFNDLVARNPVLRLFTLSPAQTALDLSARAFPVFRPAPVLTDTAPRTAPAAAPVQAPRSDPRPLALAAVALVVLALGVGLWGAGLDRAPRRAPAPTAARLEVTG